MGEGRSKKSPNAAKKGTYVTIEGMLIDMRTNRPSEKMKAISIFTLIKSKKKQETS